VRNSGWIETNHTLLAHIHTNSLSTNPWRNQINPASEMTGRKISCNVKITTLSNMRQGRINFRT